MFGRWEAAVVSVDCYLGKASCVAVVVAAAAAAVVVVVVVAVVVQVTMDY